MKEGKDKLLKIYAALKRTNGHQRWWPAKTPFEVMIGAILTQNTSWTNVEKAIGNLRKSGVMSYRALSAIGKERLASLIRPSGYYNQKAKKLKNFLSFLKREYKGSVTAMKKTDTSEIRKSLIAINGIGPETADSILLYALKKPSFVIDAYTLRIFQRLGFLNDGIDYETARGFFMSVLPVDTDLYNDYHAQIVVHGKNVCRKKPVCSICPLKGFCSYGEKHFAGPVP
jgi:endonuclease-3 related protein